MIITIYSIVLPFSASAETITGTNYSYVLGLFDNAEYGAPNNASTVGLSDSQLAQFQDVYNNYSYCLVRSYVDTDNDITYIYYYCSDEQPTINYTYGSYSSFYFIVGSGYCITITDCSGDVSVGFTSQSRSTLSFSVARLVYTNYFYVIGGGSGSSEEDSTFLGSLTQALYDLFYSDGAATLDWLLGDDSILDYINNLGDDWCNYVKSVLGISDSDTLNSVLDNIYITMILAVIIELI